MNRRIIIMPLIMLFVSVSCSMLPVEEEVLPAPVIKAYESAVYKFEMAEKGDMVKYKDVSVSYIPAREERLSFPIGDILIKNVYVKVGDSVKEGQVLAELDKSYLENDLKEAEFSLEKTHLDIRQSDESYALDRRASLLSKSDQAQLNYDKMKNDLLSRQEILEVQIAEMEKQMEDRTIRASMDGTATMVRKVTEGDKSVENERFIVVSDKSLSVFTANGQDTEFFSIGKKVEIKVGSDYYEAVVTAPEELGIINPKDNSAYFVLTDPTISIKENAYGSIRHILDQRTAVIRIPQKALHSANELNYVYMLEDNVRVMRTVKTGMEADGMVEIISGLEEGELIISEG